MPPDPQNFLIILFILTSINSSLAESSSIDIHCSFTITSKVTPLPYVYGCSVDSNLKITEPGIKINEIKGHHGGGRKHHNVAFVYISSVEMNFFPVGLDTIFSESKTLAVESTQLMEIHQYDLKGFTKLEYLMIVKNLLEVLEKDLFKYNKELFYINMNENKLKRIDEKIFDDLTRLNFLHLLSNECIRMFGHGKNRVARIVNNVKEKCSTRKMKSSGSSGSMFKSWVFWICVVFVVLVVLVAAGVIVVKKKLN